MSTALIVALIGAVAAIFGSTTGVVGGVVVALMKNRGELPVHMQQELKRLTQDTAMLRAEVSNLTASIQMYRDHIDILEHHIWTGEGPPPPKPPPPGVIYSPNPFIQE